MKIIIENLTKLMASDFTGSLDLENLQHLPFFLSWKDRNGKYLGCNNYKAQYIGFKTSKDVLGLTDNDIWPDSANNLRINDKKVITKNKAIIFFEQVELPTVEKINVITYKIPWQTNSQKIAGNICLGFILNNNITLRPTDPLLLSGDFPSLLFKNDKLSSLTQRQTDCLFYLVKGMTIKQTAQKMGLSPKTVEHYLENIKTKLNCHTRLDLVTSALKLHCIKTKLAMEDAY